MFLCREKCEWCRFAKKTSSEVLGFDLKHDDNTITRIEYAEYYCNNRGNTNFGRRFVKKVERPIGPPWMKKNILKKWIRGRSS